MARSFVPTVVPIYKGMDMGTAKPTDAEQGVVKHWGLDLVEPGERFTAADLSSDMRISALPIYGKRGKGNFLLWGYGPYVDAVFYDYRSGDTMILPAAIVCCKMSIESLQNYGKTQHTITANISNKRYIVRAIEQNGINNSSNDVPITNSVAVEYLQMQQF